MHRTLHELGVQSLVHGALQCALHRPPVASAARCIGRTLHRPHVASAARCMAVWSVLSAACCLLRVACRNVLHAACCMRSHADEAREQMRAAERRELRATKERDMCAGRSGGFRALCLPQPLSFDRPSAVCLVLRCVSFSRSGLPLAGADEPFCT
jgi:hypothetical protein